MASLHKDPRGKSPFWYVSFRTPDGKQHFKSTKETERKKAIAFRDSLQHACNDAQEGNLTEKRARELIGQVVAHTTGRNLPHFTVRAWFDKWLGEKEKTKADKTLDRYQQVIRDFLSSLGERAELPLHQITWLDVEQYRDKITAAGKSNRTANLSITVISAAFNAALRKHLLDANPCSPVDRLREEGQERDTFTPSQVSTLAAAAEGDWKGAILLAYYTGARLSDVANMQWSALDWKNKTLSFTPSKTRKPLIIPLHPQLEKELRKNPGIGRAPMFPELAGKGTGGKHGLSGLFTAIMHKAGIHGQPTQASGGRTLSSLSFHSLRHSFTSAMANAGV